MYLHRAFGEAPKMSRSYDADFKLSAAYKESLPDMMEAEDAIQGAPVPIQQVGVSDFKLPLKYKTKAGQLLTLETSVTGSVSLEVVALNARIKLTFSYPMMQPSLRSGLEGWQYYKVSFEGIMDAKGQFRSFVEFDYVYSSACPCSAELSEHARDVRGAYAVPHNQRSKARVKVEIAPGARFAIEDLQKHCLNALKTETQVMVKREDEQAFAEMNGVYIKFVEDAARLVYAELAKDKRIIDFQVACSHLESLHSHDAVSVICKGVPGGFTADFMEFRDLVC